MNVNAARENGTHKDFILVYSFSRATSSPLHNYAKISLNSVKNLKGFNI